MELLYYFDATATLRKKSPYSELFWSAVFPHFPAFGLNTEKYGVSLRIQSKCGKILARKNSAFGHFSRHVIMNISKIPYFRKILKIYFNPFSTNVPLLYPHFHTSGFLMFSGGVQVKHWLKMN